MRSNAKSVLTILFFTILSLYQPAFAAPLISIVDNNPFPPTVSTNSVTYGTYILTAKPGLNIEFLNRFPYGGMQQITTEGDSCGQRTMIPASGKCTIYLKYSVPGGNGPGIVKPIIKACIVGVKSSCIEHKITVQITDAPPPPTLSSITISSNTPSIASGSSTTFTAVGKDAAGNVIPNLAFTWSSGDVGIASIDSGSGVATGVRTGNVTIIATSNGVQGRATLAVTPGALKTITVSPNASSIASGNNTTFTAVGTDAAGNTIPNLVFAWSSGDAGIASIDSSSGVATGVRTGNVAVVATSNGVQGRATLAVTPGALKTITVSPDVSKIESGNNTRFTAVGTDAVGNIISNLVFAWSSADAGIASIDSSSGVATGVRTGNVTVVATSNGVQGRATLAVTPGALKTITVSPNASSIASGNHTTFTAVGKDAAGNVIPNLAFTWSSGDKGIASIDSSSGVATGAKVGNATITATSGDVKGTAMLEVTPGALHTITVSTSTPSVASGSSTTFTAIGTDAAGNTISNLNFAWSSGDAGIASIDSSSGVATGVKVGNATIIAASGDVKGTAMLEVTPGALQTITVSPNRSSIASGNNATFTAVGTDAAGNEIPNLNFVWTSGDTGIASIDSSSGVATGVKVGNATITATSGDVKGTAMLEVTLGALHAITVSTGTPSVASGSSTTFTAVGTDAAGNEIPNLNFAWTSDDTAIVSIDSSSGVATGAKVGSAAITAASGDVKGTAMLEVTPGALNTITVSPSISSVASGNNTTFTAIGADAAGNEIPNLNFAWTSDDTGIASIDSSSGVATGAKVGSATITAISGDVKGTAMLEVTPGALHTITVNPDKSSVVSGNHTTFTAVGTDAAGNTIPNLAFTWSSGDTGVASIDSSSGVATGAKVGSATITAASGDVKSTAMLEVTLGALQAITVSPNTSSIASGNSTRFTAVGTDAAGNTIPNIAFTWSSGDTGIASIDSSSGVATGAKVGSATITAASGDVKGTAMLEVTLGALQAITVSPNTSSIASGNSTRFTAVGTDAAGNEIPNLNFAWSSGDKGIASIDSSSGVATGAKVGSTTITATSGDVKGTAMLEVTPGASHTITVSPDRSSVASGSNTRFVAVGTDAAGNTISNLVFAWSSGDKGIASIDSSSGVATGVKVGNATITATSGDVKGTAMLEVTPGALHTITVSTSTPSVASGSSTTFTAIGTDAAGNTISNLNFVWSSGDKGIASIDSSSGVATGAKVGSAAITAASGDVKGTAMLEVTPGALQTITVSPDRSSIASGNNTTFTAVGTDAAGNTIPNRVFVWSSGDTGIASIDSSSGVATGVKVGSATITATSSGIHGIATLTVTPAILASIDLSTKTSLPLPKGSIALFKATGIYTDGSTHDITDSVKWASSDDKVASIPDPDMGIAKAVAATGSVSITATSGAIVGRMTLTVAPAVLGSIEVTTTATKSLPKGSTAQFTATPKYTDGTTTPAVKVVWTSSDDTVASVDSSSGLVTTKKAATTPVTITATYTPASGAAITGQATLTVTEAVVEGLTVTSDKASVAAGLQAQFTATPKYTDGTTTPAVAITWTSSDDTVASVDSSGLITTKKAATTPVTITATYTPTSGVAITGQATLKVTAAVVKELTVTSDKTSVAAGLQAQFTATPKYTDDTIVPAVKVVWTSSDDTVASVDSNSGLVTTKKDSATPVTITATYTPTSGAAITAHSMLTVSSAVLKSIIVTPSALKNVSLEDNVVRIAAGLSVKYTATGINTDGSSTGDITGLVNWDSNMLRVATIDKGIAKTLKEGLTTITASLGTVESQPQVLLVTSAEVASMVLSPANQSVPVGGRQTFSIVQWKYTDNTSTTAAPAGAVTWNSDNSSVATVDSKGSATVYKKATPGQTTTITATYTNPSGAKATGTAVLTVAAALQSITVTPVNPSISVRKKQQFIATGVYSDGTTKAITEVTWDSNNTNIATIDTKGLASAIKQGSTKITASSAGITSKPQILKVTKAVNEVDKSLLTASATINMNFVPVYFNYATPAYDVHVDDSNIYAVTGRSLYTYNRKNKEWKRSDVASADIISICVATSTSNPASTIINALMYNGNSTSIYDAFTASFRNIMRDREHNKDAANAELISMHGSSRLYCSSDKAYVTGLFGTFGGEYALSVSTLSETKYTYTKHDELGIPKNSNTYGTYVTPDGSRIIVATDSGVSVSLDKGSTWNNYSETKKTPGFLSDTVYAVSGNSDGTIFYVGTDKGLLKGEINGEVWNWSILADKASGKLKSDIVYDLYTSADGKSIYVATAAGLSISKDIDKNSRATWTTYTNNSLASNTIFKVYVWDKEIYVATAAGLFTSSNGGEGWEPSNLPLSGYTNIQYISVNQNGKLAIAAPGEGLSITDQGNSFQSFRVSSHHLASDLIEKVYVSANGSTFAIANDNSISMLGRFDVSRGQWKFISNKKDLSPMFKDMTFVDISQTQAGDATYLAMRNGQNRYNVVKSEDGGITWHAFKNNLNDLQSIYVTNDGSRVLVATGDGVYDINQGSNLTQSLPGKMRFFRVIPITDDEFYAVTFEGDVYLGNSLYEWEKITNSHNKPTGIINDFNVVKKDNKPYVFVATQAGLFIGGLSLNDNNEVVWYWSHSRSVGEVSSVSSYTDEYKVHVYITSAGRLYRAEL